MADDISKRLEQERKQLALLQSAHEDSSKAAAKYLALEKQLGDVADKNSELYQQLKRDVDEAKGSLDGYSDEIVDQTRKVEQLTAEQEKYNKALARQKELLDKLATVATDLTGVNVKQLASVTGLTTAFMEQAKAVNTAATELSKATGFTDALRGDMMELAKENKALGATVGETSQVVAGLTTSFKEFATLSTSQRRDIGQMALEFEALGVSADATGRAMDILSRGMSMTADQAAQATYGLDQFAQQVGLPTSQVIEDLNAIGPQMARFGNKGVEEFKKLTKAARGMGLEIQEAFNLAEAFDTFEGAADLAGKLNAQIGLQLNSVDLMRASHAERLQLLKQEFDLRGKNFDTMGRRQRQAIAEVLGVDEDFASRLFGDPVALRKYQKEQKTTQERSKAFTDITKKLAAAMQNLAIQFEPVINGFISIMTFFAENPIIPMVLAIGAAIIGLTMALGQMAPVLALVLPSFAALGPTTGAAAPGVLALGQAFATAAPHMLRGAGALLLISGSFFIISKAFREFAGLEWKTLAQASLVLAGLTGALFGLGTLLSNPIGAGIFGAGVIGIVALAGALGLLGMSLESVGDGLGRIGDTANAFERIINVTTKVDAAGLDRMHEVVDEIVRVGAVAQGGTAGILGEVASAITAAAGAMVNAPAPVVNGSVTLDGIKLGNFVASDSNKRNSLEIIE